MKQAFRTSKKFWLASLLSVITGFSDLPTALAEQVLTSAQQPLQVKLTTTLNAETSHYGDHFEGLLTDSYQMGGKTLPQGTLFKGHVQRVRRSMPLGMPGYVVLEIDEAQLPTGTVHHFEPNGVVPKSGRIMNPNAYTGKKLFKDNLPYTILSTAISVPLQVSTGFSSWAILPITLGSRMAFGVANQVSHRNQSAATQSNGAQNQQSASMTSAVGQGLMQGSGLNNAYHFLTAAPEPVLTEGTVISLHFRQTDLTSLFTAAEATTAHQPEQSIPVAAPKAKESTTQSDSQAPAGEAGKLHSMDLQPKQIIQTSDSANPVQK